jgi:5-methylthioadenosine/S-adenosylhomocysteine deaminase
LTHLAETQDEVQIAADKHHATPAAYLDSLGFWKPGTVAAHAVWMTPEDMVILKRGGVGVSHNPESNMKLASGVAPVTDMRAAGLVVGLGTDGAASNNDLDMLGEMGSAARLQKVANLDPTAASAHQVLRMATLGGARALHMEDRIGSLEPGKRADLVLIDLSAPSALPLFDPISHVVYSARSDAVETVIIEGKVVMERRRMRTLDTEEIRRRVERFGRKIRAALPE